MTKGGGGFQVAPAPGCAAEACSTCGGGGSIPWMVESDPNLYQEPDADGRVPCPDCVIPPAVKPQQGAATTERKP